MHKGDRLIALQQQIPVW